jgi:anti-sigma factor RsiW
MFGTPVIEKMKCSEIRPNLEAYVLDALDPLNRARVENHLLRCNACRLTLQDLRKVVGELPQAVGRASDFRPPSALKDRLMQSVQAEVQAHSIRDAFAPKATAPPARGRWAMGPRLVMGGIAVAAVLMLALLSWSVSTNQRMQQAISDEQATRQQIDALRQQQELAIPVFNSLSTQEIVLNSPDSNSTAYGKVLVEPYKPTIVFVAYNLPPAPIGEKYHLWTINRGVMELVGEFTPNDRGFAMVVFVADRTDPVLKEILVTRQSPASIYPSSNRVLVWRADPNDLSEDLSFNSLFPRPTVTETGR